jgi:hypothetical protein
LIAKSNAVGSLAHTRNRGRCARICPAGKHLEQTKAQLSKQGDLAYCIRGRDIFATLGIHLNILHQPDELILFAQPGLIVISNITIALQGT